MRPGPWPIYSYALRAACRQPGRARAAWIALLPVVLLAARPATAASQDGAQPLPALEEIIVTASLREQPLAAVPASITVLGQEKLQAAGLQHFADVLGLVPNLNWSGGTSRPRFFQLRGIGELEQYQRQLEELRQALLAGDAAALEAVFAEARTMRRAWAEGKLS